LAGQTHSNYSNIRIYYNLFDGVLPPIAVENIEDGKNGWSWVASGANGEYYLTYCGGDPSTQWHDAGSYPPNGVFKNHNFIGSMGGGTPGVLNADAWGYGDSNSLGYSTIYYRPPAGHAPGEYVFDIYRVVSFQGTIRLANTNANNGKGNLIANNVFYNGNNNMRLGQYGEPDPYRAVYAQSNSENWEIESNIFYGQNTAIYGSSQMNASGNLYYLNKYSCQGGVADSNSIFSDPLFADAPKSDFRIQMSSPVIDRSSGWGQARDFEGNQKSGPAWDIGAYEYAGTACIHKSEIPPCDGCVSMSELTAFIDRWKLNNQDATIRELIEAIGLWKQGGC